MGSLDVSHVTKNRPNKLMKILKIINIIINVFDMFLGVLIIYDGNNQMVVNV